jgi:hypothetical protein
LKSCWTRSRICGASLRAAPRAGRHGADGAVLRTKWLPVLPADRIVILRIFHGREVRRP